MTADLDLREFVEDEPPSQHAPVVKDITDHYGAGIWRVVRPALDPLGDWLKLPVDLVVDLTGLRNNEQVLRELRKLRKSAEQAPGGGLLKILLGQVIDLVWPEDEHARERESVDPNESNPHELNPDEFNEDILPAVGLPNLVGDYGLVPLVGDD